MAGLQRELFPIGQVKRPRNCLECVYHFEDPYHRCAKQPGALIDVRRICKHFIFSDDQSVLLYQHSRVNAARQY